MTISASNLQLLKSESGIGGAISDTQVEGFNLFGIFNGDETRDGHTEYACVYAKNNSNQTAFNMRLFVENETPHQGANYSIALGTAVIDATEPATANDTTAPANVSFVEADLIGNALEIGDLEAGEFKSIWVRLAVEADTSAKDTLALSLNLRCDSGE